MYKVYEEHDDIKFEFLGEEGQGAVILRDENGAYLIAVAMSGDDKNRRLHTQSFWNYEFMCHAIWAKKVWQ